MTRFRAFLLGLGLLFVAFIAVEYFRPQPTDWTPTFINRDKIPYGTYVLYDQLPALFPGQPVTVTRLPIANQLLPTLGADADRDSALAANGPALRPDAATYLFVNDQFVCSPLDRDALLRYLSQGNQAFIAAERITSQLLDTLHLETESVLDLDSLLLSRAQGNHGLSRATTTLTLVNPPRGAARRYRFPQSEVPAYFRARHGARATVLVHDERQRPVLVWVPVGRGGALLSSTPAAFSNLLLLRPATAGFAFAALSALPAGRPVFWDEYQKQGPLGEQSLLRVVKQHEALRWALWLGALGALLFVLVEARRRQRIIPILQPLPNTTLLFTRTVAGLYRQGSNHALIAEKKIGLFHEYLRTRYHEPTLDLADEATRERLAQKSGIPRTSVDALVRRIHVVLTAPQVSDTDLLALNKAINEFRRTAA
ncbi:hypothetical protein K3G63_09860 [Hymenobacter sp. HSC-4F20]|uniref:DUF4350 domain-containing protein n=1 Tax=Hymenobacter sp. HSC-4F20 TaxID=2864135 RepID=UPI001C730A55|nr:DUF4350 domain-containing protein [Hymenobacter sp. HSC-4F20]MBX0290743.1 hypothetical protein [Hymenobacter sp. HSC-4F20]